MVGDRHYKADNDLSKSLLFRRVWFVPVVSEEGLLVFKFHRFACVSGWAGQGVDLTCR